MKGKKKIMAAFLVVWGLSVAVLARAEEPLNLRLRWDPGRVLKYQVKIQSRASSQGEEATLKMGQEVTFRVLEQDKGKSNGRGHVRVQEVASLEDPQAVGPAIQLSPAGPLSRVEIDQGPMDMEMALAGHRIKVAVTREAISATLDGGQFPNLEDLRRDMKPVQELLRARTQVSITDTGEVMEVKGLEGLDPAMRKELALALLEGIALPGKAMRIGDSYTQKLSLAGIFPQQPGGSSNPLADQVVEIRRTLVGIERSKAGHQVAVFSATLQKKFEGVPLDETGQRGSAEVDILYRSWFDVSRGLFLKETGEGTIVFSPQEVGAPKIHVKPRFEVALVD